MVRTFLLFCLAAAGLNGSILDWFSPLSERAKRAQAAMEGFDEIAEKALQGFHVPGAAIGVVVDGHLVYAKGFGLRDIEQNLSVTADTLFPIGSCTKAFTAFAMGTLVDESLVQWDQLVIDVLPDFRLFDQYATQNLTIRDILTHRSGMPRHDFMWYNSTMTREEVMRRLRYLEPSCDLRERYQYNNLMYLTAGYAMEKLTGKSWEAIIADKILKPLEMNRTSFHVAEMQKEKDHAVPYLDKGDSFKKMQFRDISLIGPAGSINSSVNDLARWVQMQLAGGVYDNRPLISGATLQEMHTPQVIIPGAPETKESLINAYGIGWAIASYRGNYFLSHDGGIDGYTSVVLLIPQKGVGVIVLANRNLTSLPRFLSLQAVDRVLELPFIDWVQQGVDAFFKSKETAKENKMKEDLLRKKGTMPSHLIESYAGEYEHPGYGTIKIECIDGRLRGTFNGLSFMIDHWHYDVFSVAEEMQDTLISREGTKVTFRTNVSGEVDTLSIPLEPKASEIVFVRKHEAVHSTISYLRQFIGLYEIYGYTVEIAIRNHALCAVIPGQPLYELMPSSAENEFTVKSMTGYNVRFVMDKEGRVEEVLLVQPYGAFTAKPKR